MLHLKPMVVVGSDTVTIAEAAALIRCSQGSIVYQIKHGGLAACKVNGKCWLLDRADVLAYKRRSPNRRSRAEALEAGKMRRSERSNS